uniref:Pyrin domain-containing protein n=1 Tax=Seriola lalandi dorsalis TaxID=1841481 RepID=A0A3B4X609_SERLL
MAPKTRKALVRETLQNLRKAKFEAFVEALLDRREEPRVKCADVEDQGFLKVTNVVVSTFTEQKAPQVVAEILREIGCGEEAEKLGKLTVSGAEEMGVRKGGVKRLGDCLEDHYLIDTCPQEEAEARNVELLDFILDYSGYRTRSNKPFKTFPKAALESESTHCSELLSVSRPAVGKQHTNHNVIFFKYIFSAFYAFM